MPDYTGIDLQEFVGWYVVCRSNSCAALARNRLQRTSPERQSGTLEWAKSTVLGRITRTGKDFMLVRGAEVWGSGIGKDGAALTNLPIRLGRAHRPKTDKQSVWELSPASGGSYGPEKSGATRVTRIPLTVSIECPECSRKTPLYHLSREDLRRPEKS